MTSTESKGYEAFRNGVGLGSASAFWPGKAQPLADRALLVTGHGNVGFAYDDRNVVMFDTGTPQVFGEWAMQELRRFSQVPIRVVIVPEFYYPDTLIDSGLSMRVGDMTLELRTGLGETDDAVWLTIPERRLLFAGDFLLRCFPTIGNPFKVQRYTEGWAQALEEMAALDVEAAAPGHGPAVAGRAAVRDMLLETAGALRTLHDEVVRRLNAAQPFEQILAEVRLPADLAAKPYLVPIYGSSVYTVHALLREYAGWYEYNPSHLHASLTRDIAAEVVALCGAGPLLECASTLASADPQLALHLVDLVVNGGPGEPQARARALKAELLDARAAEMSSFISYNMLSPSAQALRAQDPETIRSAGP